MVSGGTAWLLTYLLGKSSDWGRELAAHVGMGPAAMLQIRSDVSRSIGSVLCCVAARCPDEAQCLHIVVAVHFLCLH